MCLQTTRATPQCNNSLHSTGLIFYCAEAHIIPAPLQRELFLISSRAGVSSSRRLHMKPIAFFAIPLMLASNAALAGSIDGNGECRACALVAEHSPNVIAVDKMVLARFLNGQTNIHYAPKRRSALRQTLFRARQAMSTSPNIVANSPSERRSRRRTVARRTNFTPRLPKWACRQTAPRVDFRGSLQSRLHDRSSRGQGKRAAAGLIAATIPRIKALTPDRHVRDCRSREHAVGPRSIRLTRR